MALNATFDADADGNSVVTQLTAPTFTSNIWESSWVNVTPYRRLTGIIAMNQASAVNGVVIEQSVAASPSADTDAHYWTSTTTTNSTHPVNGSVTYHNAAWSVERVGLFARLVVKHGGSAPTTFSARLIGAGIT